MASLYKRATPAQHLVLRMVEGAVKNAFDVHPQGSCSVEYLARSIAKRAAGTLTAGWPDVLARAQAGSDGLANTVPSARPAASDLLEGRPGVQARKPRPSRSP